MAKNVQMVGSNAASEDQRTGLDRQITIDTSTYEIRVHDGVTQGGHRIPNESGVQNMIDSASDGATGVLHVLANEAALTALTPATNIIGIVLGDNEEEVYVWRAGTGDQGTIASNVSGHWRRLDSQAGILVRMWRAGTVNLQVNGTAPTTNQETTLWLDNSVAKAWDGAAYVNMTPALFTDAIEASTGKKLKVSQNLGDIADDALARTNIGAIGITNIQTFITNGTWNKPANLAFVVVELCGGGGGGSGALANTAGGASGGAGGYSKKVILAADLGATELVTIGAGGSGGAVGASSGASGGTTSFGAHLSATGGIGGLYNSYSITAGIGYGGDVNLAGGSSIAFWGPDNVGATGGASYFGGGGSGGGNNNAYGVAGQAPGSGGGAGLLYSSDTGGGAGANGIVIITEYKYA